MRKRRIEPFSCRKYQTLSHVFAPKPPSRRAEVPALLPGSSVEGSPPPLQPPAGLLSLNSPLSSHAESLQVSPTCFCERFAPVLLQATRSLPRGHRSEGPIPLLRQLTSTPNHTPPATAPPFSKAHTTYPLQYQVFYVLIV